MVTFWHTADVVLKYKNSALMSPPLSLLQTQLMHKPVIDLEGAGDGGGRALFMVLLHLLTLSTSQRSNLSALPNTFRPPRIQEQNLPKAQLYYSTQSNPKTIRARAVSYLVRASMLFAVYPSHARQRVRLSPVVALNVPSGQSWHGAKGIAVVMADGSPLVGSGKNTARKAKAPHYCWCGVTL